MENVKQHFEKEAREYDAIICRLIPYYEQMLDALVAALPFPGDREIRVVDLGCGTGTIAKRIRDAYPRSTVTCVDIAENMLRVAQAKLGAGAGMRYQRANFEQYEFDSDYDAAVSSLALHHLVKDEDKIKFYKKIHACLRPGGVFFNADVVLGSGAHLRDVYLEKWRKYIHREVSNEEIDRKWIPTHRDEDHPAGLTDQLHWLQDIGFTDVDVLWKYYNFAVYGGCKTAG